MVKAFAFLGFREDGIDEFSIVLVLVSVFKGGEDFLVIDEF